MYTSVFPTCPVAIFFFFFNDTATTEIYTLSLHDALPISRADDWRDAHFGQFVAILDEYLQLREANPAFDPVRPVVPVNVRPAERDTDIPLAGDPVAQRTMDLLNVSYESLLLMLQRLFAHTQETDPQLT